MTSAPTAIDRAEYISLLTGPDAEAPRRAGAIVRIAEEIAGGIPDAVGAFISHAAVTPALDENDANDTPWTIMDELKTRLSGIVPRGVIDADRLTDWLRGGIFAGGSAPPEALRIIWDSMEDVDPDVASLRGRLAKAAEDAEREARAAYEQAATIARGMRIDEFRALARDGRIASPQNGSGRGFVVGSPDSGVAIRYALATVAGANCERDDGVMVEFEGDAVRASGAARLAEYHYVAQDGPDAETWDSDLPFAIAAQQDVRLRAGTDAESLQPRTVTFVRAPEGGDLEAARRLVGADGEIVVLNGGGPPLTAAMAAAGPARRSRNEHRTTGAPNGAQEWR